MGLLSDEAKAFLENLPPIEETMRELDFAEIEQKLEREGPDQRQLARLRRRY